MPEFLKSILKSKPGDKRKGLRKDQLLILLLTGVLLAVIAIPVNPKEDEEAVREESGGETDTEVWGEEAPGADAAGEYGTYEERQERRLREILSHVEGVGRVEVMLTLSASAERVVEKDQPAASQTVEEADSEGGSRRTREETWEEETIYREEEDGARTPYVVKELEPRVEGVIVIAEGGGNSLVKQNILEAVEALFPVDAHKIKIMKMEDAK